MQPTADFELVESLIQSFLDARADVIVGGADPASMAPVALPFAIDFVIGERAYNQQQADLDRAGSTIHHFGPASQEAVAKILDALADHYAVISNRADWASPWLRRVGLRLASRSSGDVEKLSSSLETAKADLRDL